MAIAIEDDYRYLWGRRLWDWTRTYESNQAISVALGYRRPSNYSRLVGRPLTANLARKFATVVGLPVEDLFVKVRKDDPRCAKSSRPGFTFHAA